MAIGLSSCVVVGSKLPDQQKNLQVIYFLLLYPKPVLLDKSIFSKQNLKLPSTSCGSYAYILGYFSIVNYTHLKFSLTDRASFLIDLNSWMLIWHISDEAEGDK